MAEADAIAARLQAAVAAGRLPPAAAADIIAAAYATAAGLEPSLPSVTAADSAPTPGKSISANLKFHVAISKSVSVALPAFQVVDGVAGLKVAMSSALFESVTDDRRLKIISLFDVPCKFIVTDTDECMDQLPVTHERFTTVAAAIANDAACIQHLGFRTGAGFDYGVFGRKLTNLMIIVAFEGIDASASSTGWRSWCRPR